MIRHTVHCDKCGRKEEYGEGAGRAAAPHGWRRVDGKDFCGVCLATAEETLLRAFAEAVRQDREAQGGDKSCVQLVTFPTPPRQ